MIWLSLRNSDSYPIRIDEPEGTTVLCLASQSDTPRRNAFSSFGAGRSIRHAIKARAIDKPAPRPTEMRSTGCDWCPRHRPRTPQHLPRHARPRLRSH